MATGSRSEEIEYVAGRLLIDPARPPEPGWLRIAGGRIVDMGFADLPPSGPPDLGGADRVISPAFIDAHLHIPQIDAVGCDGLPLLEWLDRVVFPSEAWWGRGRALHDARTAARRMAREGTVGAAVYLSSHPDASAEALGLLARLPMRWLAGRVAMDRRAPEALIEPDRARAARRPVPSVGAARPAEAGRLTVSLNPRFAVSCSDELLAEVGWAVRDGAARGATPWVQTHVSEAVEECRLVAELFPDSASYTDVYDRFGLLTERTLLAHGVHLSEAELRLIARRGSVLVHCPTANTFLRAGMFDLGAARRAGVRLALGSDVAGGPDVAMPRVARGMIEVAKARAMAGLEAEIPRPAEAWRMITRGNADALGWSDGGRLEVGAAADLLVLAPPASWLDEHLIGRLIYNWTSDLIEARVFAGRRVDPARIADGPPAAGM
ncbi:MAG: amidohydrolase family protein [Planctomycetota bacterium]|nr:amidohydrolase family protein [Planctomycetota bacterium]